MEAEALTRAVIESAVDRGIREIAEDPSRGLRKLVDLGGMFAKGRFQKRYIGVLRQMLEDGRSPYYAMACSTVRQVEREHLRTFGVNVGWQSWTVGARRIRALEAEGGYNVPWCITFRLGGAMEAGEYRRLVSQGAEKGICTYFLMAGEDPAHLALALDLAALDPRCAFVLVAPPALLGDNPNILTARLNLMVLVDAGLPGWQGAAAGLRACRRLYGLFRRYGSGTEAEEIASGRWVEEVLPHAGTFALLQSGPGCPAQAREAVSEYVERCRGEQRYPLVLLDYYPDLLRVDQTISDGPCFLGVGPDGTCTGFDGAGEAPAGGSLRELDLGEFLTRCCPRGT